MAELNNQDYVARRAQHSRELALNATRSGVTRIDLEMATRYEELATATSAEANEDVC